MIWLNDRAQGDALEGSFRSGRQHSVGDLRSGKDEVLLYNAQGAPIHFPEPIERNSDGSVRTELDRACQQAFLPFLKLFGSFFVDTDGRENG
ncbi:MAG TPA: hypothetical protein VMA75_05175 [Candidatus Paceibacterota bacterium]|nr:hypothetical protein [Candidatus Paceibacterota bacterium]